MKIRFIPILVSFLCINTISAQDVPEQQMPLITKVTATWCPFCGGWGWDAFEKLYEENIDKAILITNHFSGDLRSYAGEAIADNFDAFGQPVFYVNNENQIFSSSTYSSKADDVKTKVENIYNMSPAVNAGVTASLDGKQLTANVKTKFFQAVSGEYYISVYVIEDGVINYQSGYGNNAMHRNVLRESMSPEDFGVELGSGNYSSGMEISKTFDMTLDDSWNVDNIKLLAIIWKKEGSIYEYINGNLIENWYSTTATKDLVEEFEVKLWPSVTQSNINLSFNATDTKIFSLDIINQEGKIIRRHQPSVSNNHQYIFAVDQLIPGGYYLQISTEKGMATTPFVVK